MEKGDKLTIVLLLALVAFAVIIVDERWLRAAIAFVPALLLAQRAMLSVDVAEPPPLTGHAAQAASDERRADTDVRGHIDELLKSFREFYTTCHLMATGNLEPDEAKDLAAGIERRLNKLLAEITDASRSESG